MKNKMNKIYGFEVTNIAGQGFKRWFNSNTIRMCHTKECDLPPELERVCSAQCFMQSFKKAFDYSKLRSQALGFDFKELTEEDYKKTGNPVKKLFNKIFKK